MTTKLVDFLIPVAFKFLIPQASRVKALAMVENFKLVTPGVQANSGTVLPGFTT